MSLPVRQLRHGAAALLLGLTATVPVLAQPASLPGPPPAGGLPPAPGGGIPAGLPPPPEPVRSPAQKLVAALPPAGVGVMLPLPEPTADTPMPSADPRDFQGTWSHGQDLEFRIAKDMFGSPLPYTMAGAEVLVRRVRSQEAGKPISNASADCRPPGQIWQLDLNTPFQIFAFDNWLEFLFLEYHGRWYISQDAAQVTEPAQRDYMGHSTSRWDGNTLVVETAGFRQGMWLDPNGTPISRNGRLTQRIRKVDAGDRHPFLEIVTTVDDPLYYTRAWSFVRSYAWVPGKAVFREYNCEEQIGDPSVDPDAGLVSEPAD